MGHKTDQRRYPSTEALSPARARSLVKRCLEQLEAGKRAYTKADELLEQLVAGGLVGSEIKLTDGRTAAVVDQFAGKNKVFKSNAFSRFKVEVKSEG